MRRIKLLVLIALLSASSAFAGELDTHYLRQFGELATDSSKAVLKSAQTRAVHKCGMPLRHNLKRDWKKLEATTQKTLAKYLTKPVLLGETTVASSGGHFIIHYATSGSDLPNPVAPYTVASWVQKVADIFEEVYAKEVTNLGYLSPTNIPYPVYLQQLATLSKPAYGFTDSDILTGQSATSFITIDNDFADSLFHPYNGLPGLQITAAHEFHHAIQFNYNYYFENWYAEVTATWMEDEVYDSVNQLYDYTSEYITNTASSLDYGDGYSRWIFNRYLYEQFYSQLLPKDIIWKIWETFASEPVPPSGADIPMLPFLDKVLKSQGGSLAASFNGFAKRIYLRNWSSHTNEIGKIPDYNPKATYSSYPVNSSSLPAPAATLPAYSFGYYKFSPGNGAPTNLNITFSPSGGCSITAFKKTTGGVVTEYPFTPVSGTLTIDSFNVPGISEVALLICNTSPTSATVNFSTDGTLPVPPATASGSSNSCFIATAAYGNYLHPEVMTLRDFRDRHLLTNLPGRAFVAFYYSLSPPIADFIRAHESARFIVRIFLAPIIFAVKHLWLAAAAVSILALISFARMWKKVTRRTGMATENR